MADHSGQRIVSLLATVAADESAPRPSWATDELVRDIHELHHVPPTYPLVFREFRPSQIPALAQQPALADLTLRVVGSPVISGQDIPGFFPVLKAEGLELIAWRVTIYAPGNPLIAENRLYFLEDRRTLQERIVTRLDLHHTERQYLQIRQGLMALELISARVGRPCGAKPGSKTEYWLARVEAISEKAARAEYYAQTPRGPGRYKWWNDNILRTLRRRKQRQ